MKNIYNQSYGSIVSHPLELALYRQLHAMRTYEMISYANKYAWTPPEHTPVGFILFQNSTDPTIVHANEKRPYMIRIQARARVHVAAKLAEQHGVKAMRSNKPTIDIFM